MNEAGAYLKEFSESGELIGEGFALADASTGRTVRVRNGLPAVTDGPFAEAKEQLAGFYVLDAESLERAAEIVDPRPGRPLLGRRGEAAHGHCRRGNVTASPESAPRTCCASSRRRSSAALVRRCGHFDLSEDAVQEALLAATLQWPDQGVPGNPRGWLITVAARRLTDELRSDQARRRREERAAAQVPADEHFEPVSGLGASCRPKKMTR